MVNNFTKINIPYVFMFTDILLGWFNNSSEFDIIDFFGILE